MAVTSEKLSATERLSPVGTRRAYLGIVFLLVATVVWGFWRTYFGPLLHGGVSRPWIIHVHAAVFIGWIALLTTQALLVSSGRIRDHRRLGRVGLVYGCLVFCLGVAVSFAAPILHVQAHQMPVERASLVVLYNLTDILLFGAFFAAAMIQRRRPEWHKRLILSATVALTSAAVGRIPFGGQGEYLAVWLLPLFASMVVDLVTQRRVYAISWVSLVVFVAESYKVELFFLSPIWQRVGLALTGLFV